jgi:hypothetical protein
MKRLPFYALIAPVVFSLFAARPALAQSGNDGAFVFADITFDANLQFVVMAIYNDVAYSSDPAPVNMEFTQVIIDVPVYESTSDLTNVQIDQMHVLFDFAEDGSIV